MAYLKAAIFTTGTILLALVGFFFFNFGSAYHFEQATDAFLKGDLEQATASLDKAKKKLSPAQFNLYNAYIARQKQELQRSTKLLNRAQEHMSGDSKKVQFEILINQGLNAFLSHQDEGLVGPIGSAEKLFPEDGYLALLKGLDSYLHEDYDSASYHWQRPSNRLSVSDWVKAPFVAAFTEDWIQLHLAHCHIERGQALAARQLLEELRNEASAEYQHLITYFIGLSYAKEADDKPIEAAIPYYRLALSYWNRVPISHPDLRREYQQTIDWVSAATANLIEHKAYAELPLLISVLESWKEKQLLRDASKQIYLALEDALSKRDWKSSRSLARVLDSIIKDSSLREEMGDRLSERIQTAFNSNDPEHANEAWEVLTLLNAETAPFTKELLILSRKAILNSVENDEPDLQVSNQYLSLWNKLPQSADQRQEFCAELIRLSKTLWLTSSDDKKPLRLMQIIVSHMSDEERKLVQADIETMLQAVYSVISREDHVDKLPSLLEAVEYFDIQSIDFRDKNTVANYLADAVSFFQSQSYDEARERCEWILAIYPEHPRAQTIIGAISYLEQDYVQTIEHLGSLADPNPEQIGALAISYIIQGDTEKGLRLLDAQAEAGSSLDMEDKVRLAFGLLANDNPESALAWFETILDPSPEVLAGVSIALVQQGRWEEALATIDALDAPLNSNEAILSARVIALAFSGQEDEAYTQLQQLLGLETRLPNEELPQYLKHAVTAGIGELKRDVVAGVFFFRVKEQPATALFYLNRLESLSPEVMVLKGEIMTATGHLNEAEKLFNQALEASLLPLSQRTALSSLVEIFKKQGRWDHVVDQYVKLLEEDDLVSEWRLGLAEAYATLDRWDLALQHLSHLNKSRQLPLSAASLYIEALIRTGNSPMARDIVSQWIKKADSLPIEQACKIGTALSLQPTMDLSEKILALVPLQDVDQFTAAEHTALLGTLLIRSNYRGAAKLVQEHKESLRESLDGSVGAAYLYANLGEKDEAMRWAKHAQAKWPFHPKVLTFLDEHETDAEAILARREELKPFLDRDNPSGSLQVAYVQQLLNYAIQAKDESKEVRSGYLQEALTLLDYLASANPPYPGVYYRLGQTQFMLRDIPAAQISLTKAIRLAPSHSQSLKYLALCHNFDGDQEEAINYLNLATLWTPDDVDAWKQLAKIHRKKRNLLEARGSLFNIIRYQPRNIGALVDLGGLLVEMKNPEDARVLLERAVKLDPEHVTGLALLLTSLTDPTLVVADGEHHKLRMQQHQVYQQMYTLDPEVAKRVAERLKFHPPQEMKSVQ